MMMMVVVVMNESPGRTLSNQPLLKVIRKCFQEFQPCIFVRWLQVLGKKEKKRVSHYVVTFLYNAAVNSHSLQTTLGAGLAQAV
jgi:hypothetical protein